MTTNSTLPPLQTGPAAWIGAQMAQRADEWQIELTAAEIAEVEATAARFLAAGGDNTADDATRIGAMTQRDFPLPTLGPKLLDLRRELLHGRGFALLRGLPVANYTEREAVTIFYGLGTHLGNARSQNAKGHILGHVRDLGVSSSNPNVRIYQTAERQTFHTDSTDVVGLLCLHPAKAGGLSLLVSAQTIFNELHRDHPDLLALLLQPIATDRRGEVPAGMLPYLLIPVFTWYQGYLTPFYQRQYIDSAQRFPDAPRLTDKHVAALDRFDDLTNDPRLHFSMQLERGDMQFVYNHALLHDRTGFADWPDLERRRHLLRLWLAVPGDRPLHPEFATRFGSVEVGNRGRIVVPGTAFRVPWTHELTV